MTHAIRKANEDDAGQLAVLAAVTFPLACPPGSSPADIAEDPDVTSALNLLPSAELSKCYVHPDHHGLGAAAELMRATIAAAAANGSLGIWLGVNSENAKAIRFYEKAGFRKVGTKSFRLGAAVEHDFVMERTVLE